jgi:hypothetical protein
MTHGLHMARARAGRDTARPHGRPTSMACCSMLLMLFLAGCSEPFIVFAGKRLSGEESAPPDDWAALDAIDTMQLETRPDNPYSVNVWAVGIGSDLYVGTGPDGTRWSRHLDADRDVRFRAEGRVYPLRAYPVTEPDERRRVSEAYVRKYDLDAGENWVMDALVYRLDRR